MYLGQAQFTEVVKRVPASFIDAVESDPTMLEAFQPEDGVTELMLYDEAGDEVYAMVARDEAVTPIGPDPQPQPFPKPPPPPPPIFKPKTKLDIQPFVAISPVVGVTQPVGIKPTYKDVILGPDPIDIPEDVTEVDPGVVYDEFEGRGTIAGIPWWMLLVAGGVYLATKKK